MDTASWHGLTTILFSSETLAHWFRPTKQPCNPWCILSFDVILPNCAPSGQSPRPPHACPSQWKLWDNWYVASRELMGPPLCQIHTQKSSTLWIPLMQKKKKRIIRQLDTPPSTYTPPTQLHNRLYLVSQSWWGNPLSRGHWRGVEISLWLGRGVQYGTVRPKRNICLGQNTLKWLKGKEAPVGIVLTAPVNVADWLGHTYAMTILLGLQNLSFTDFLTLIQVMQPHTMPS